MLAEPAHVATSDGRPNMLEKSLLKVASASDASAEGSLAILRGKAGKQQPRSCRARDPCFGGGGERDLQISMRGCVGVWDLQRSAWTKNEMKMMEWPKIDDEAEEEGRSMLDARLLEICRENAPPDVTTLKEEPRQMLCDE